MLNQVFQFGAGVLIAKPNAGDLAANPTPMQFGTLQEVTLEITADSKELKGRNQAPDDVARAAMKISLKAKFAKFNGKLVNDIFFGGTISVGQMKIALDEAQDIPGAVTYTVTVDNAPVNPATIEDLGVRYAATGKQMTKVAANPAVGEYTVDEATGIYTFAAADKSVKVLITYMWKDATTGITTKVTNQLMGYAPKFSAFLMQQYGGNQSNAKVFRLTATKLSRPTKVDDYTLPDFEASASADDAGNVIEFYDAQ